MQPGQEKIMKRVWNVSLTRSVISAAAFFVFLYPAAPPAIAQQGSASTEPPTFILGTVSGDPGRIVGVPLYLKGSENQPIQNVRLDLEFVSNSVKFIKADKGPAASEQDFELNVSGTEAPPDDKNISRTSISIEIAVIDSDTTKSLPNGILTFLNIDVPNEAKSYSIDLNPTSYFAQNAAGDSVQLRVEAGKLIVTLLDVPLAGCFFFTH
jgi:hypothetical protein